MTQITIAHSYYHWGSEGTSDLTPAILEVIDAHAVRLVKQRSRDPRQQTELLGEATSEALMALIEFLALQIPGYGDASRGVSASPEVFFASYK